jgi:3-oxoacyl-[acyl-carrier-protein] synthase-3
MSCSIDIKGIGTYYPENQVDNQYYLDYFKDFGVEVDDLLKRCGRNIRHISNNRNENSLTMAAEACSDALKKTGLSAEELDLIIFSSATPEFLAPSNAIILHNKLGCKSSAIAYDMNANCVGMITAIEQTSRYMMANPGVKYAMIVGSEQMNHFSQEKDAYTKTNFADAACAVILEKSEIEGSGFDDAVYYVNSSRFETMKFPECGMSNIYGKDFSEQEKRILWTGGYPKSGFELTTKLIEAVLKKCNRKKTDIKKYFISQVCRESIVLVAAAMEEDLNKFEYIGDRYGYTGTSSPLIALNQAIENGKLNRGDDIVFWSVGTGYISCALLWKY